MLYIVCWIWWRWRSWWPNHRVFQVGRERWTNGPMDQRFHNRGTPDRFSWFWVEMSCATGHINKLFVLRPFTFQGVTCLFGPETPGTINHVFWQKDGVRSAARSNLRGTSFYDQIWVRWSKLEQYEAHTHVYNKKNVISLSLSLYIYIHSA